MSTAEAIMVQSSWGPPGAAHATHITTHPMGEQTSVLAAQHKHSTAQRTAPPPPLVTIDVVLHDLVQLRNQLLPRWLQILGNGGLEAHTGKRVIRLARVVEASNVHLERWQVVRGEGGWEHNDMVALVVVAVVAVWGGVQSSGRCECRQH